jgi:demethylmenaquinone methyltransferase/2-methoxy-6-polyprenyl-1,4-benzoquinol methylase
MSKFSRYPISKLYDFAEKHYIRDYERALIAINKQLIINDIDIVLDIGGGTGFILKNIYKKAYIAINLDTSKNMLKQLKNKNIFKIQGDGTFIPLKNESINIILLINVLHHIHEKNHRILFKEIYRILKKKGTFFMMDLYFPMTFMAKIFTLIEEFSVGKTYHKQSEKIKEILIEVGLTIELITYMGKNKWIYTIKAIKN